MVKRFLRIHGLAIILSLLVGGLSVAPHFYAVRSIGSEYRGIPFMPLDDEEIYLTRMQEINDGYPEVGSPYFQEYKDEKPVMPPTGERLYVRISDTFGLSLPQTLVVAKFLFPALLFFLIYALALRLLPTEVSRLRIAGSVLAGLAVTLAYDLFAIPVWTRPVNPILGGLGLFTCIHLFWSLWQTRDIRISIPAGLLLGTLSFYFFGWALGLGIVGLLMLASLGLHDWRRASGFFLTIAISLAMNAQTLMRFVGNPEGQTLAMRNGLLLMHDPLLNKMVLACMVVFAIATFVIMRSGKKFGEIVREPWWIFCASFLVAGFVVLNQQVITGRAIWPYHFVQYTKPLVMIVTLVAVLRAVSLLSSLSLKGGVLKLTLIGCMALSLLVIGQAVVAVRGTQALHQDFRERQKDAELFAWLNTNAPKDCVVYNLETRERLDRFIPAFSRCNVYRTTVTFSGVPIERVRHNYFLELRLRGVTADTIRSYLLEHPEEIRLWFFDDWRTVFGSGSNAWTEAKIEELAPAYVLFLYAPFEEQLRRFRVDYLTSSEPLSADERRVWGVRGEEMRLGQTWLYPL